ncbi:MAG: phosphoenolpyruvate carboxykinase (ATP), partial [Planctomycetota bacterium]|nr:phosphoenolpyruvate carboxykinase (ATP) [Planctomycetota bacterium]
MDLTAYGIEAATVIRNGAPALLYEHAVLYDNAEIAANGAICTTSGEKTGRSPKDKRIVDNPESHDDIWWGPVNMPLSSESFGINRG